LLDPTFLVLDCEEAGRLAIPKLQAVQDRQIRLLHFGHGLPTFRVWEFIEPETLVVHVLKIETVGSQFPMLFPK